MINRFRARFPGGHAVLPVVHATSLDQVLRNAGVAVEAGADGVFLINHTISSDDLLAYHDVVRGRLPDLWVGLNCLDRRPTWVAEHPRVRGMWTDNAYVDETMVVQGNAGLIEHRNRTLAGWDGIYFGGVAFKGQRKVRPEHLGDAARHAMRHVDVVTTSGPGTGMAADVDKLRTMRDALGDHPLALASGVTSSNVGQYLPYVDAFLVTSSISRDFEDLDLALTRQLVEVVRDLGHQRGEPGR